MDPKKKKKKKREKEKIFLKENISRSFKKILSQA
jgi:hypothetical protein